jgi:peptidyl-prolyl cis-trans isomerase C
MNLRFLAGFTAAILILTSQPVTVLADKHDPVVAKVNDIEITRSEVERAQSLLPQQYKQVPLEMIMPTLIDSIVDGYLTAQYARDNNYTDSEEFKSEMARIERQVLQRMALTREINEKVNPDSIRARFEKFKSTMSGKEEVHARHILLKTEDEAKAVIAELDKGADFVELAKKKSTGPSASSGGDLGFFGRGQMVPEFEKAAFELEKGVYTPVAVKTQFGFHVIKSEERRESSPPTFDESKERMGAELTQEVASAFIEKLRSTAKIEKFLEKMKPATPAAAKDDKKKEN